MRQFLKILFMVFSLAGYALASPAHDAYKQAQSLRDNGDLQGALKVTQAALVSSPDDYELNLLTGDILYDLSQYQDALYYYDKALEKKKKSPEALYGAGSSSLNLEQYEKAAGYFEDGVKTKKMRGKFYYGLGLAQMELGNYTESDINLRKAIDKDEKEPLYHVALGEVNYRNKVFPTAISQFNKAIELDSTIQDSYPDIHYKIAESYLQMRNLEDAIKEYRKDLELHPSDTTAWLKMANISELSNKYSDAAFCYTKYLEIVPDDGDRWFALGQDYLNLRDQDKAAEAFEKAISLKANVAESYGYLATIYSERNEFDKAWDAYTRYEKTFGPPDSTLYWFDKGKVAIKLGIKDYSYFDSALVAFQEAIKLDSTFSAAYEYSGLAMYYKKDYAAAVPYFIKKIDLDSTSVNSLRNLAFCYLKLEQYSDAASAFKKALVVKPEDTQMRSMLGKIYTFNGDYNDAITQFEILLNDYSDELDDSTKCVIYPDLGLSYLKNGKCRSALPNLLKAEQCTPKEISVLFNTASAYQLCNKMKEANSYYRKVLKIDPGNKDAIKGEMQTRIQGE